MEHAEATVEYGLKGIYEHTIGRLAEATVSGETPIPEERLYADYAQAYVDFIRVEPWYKFDFLAPLKQLWAETPLSGANLIRRWERRFALTTELLVKEGYARLIKLGTQSVYDAPKPTTAVVLDRSPAPDAADLPRLRRPAERPAPRCWRRSRATSPSPPTAAGSPAQGVDFREIAGNDGEILVSLLVPNGWMSSAPARTLFEQPILTRPGQKRVVLAIRVAAAGRACCDRSARSAAAWSSSTSTTSDARPVPPADRDCSRCCSWPRSPSPAGWATPTLKRSQRERMTIESLAPPSGRWVDVGDSRLFVQEWGPPDGPVLLLAHGTGAWSGTWFELPGSAGGGRLAGRRGRPAAVRLQCLERPPRRARLFAPGAGRRGCCS